MDACDKAGIAPLIAQGPTSPAPTGRQAITPESIMSLAQWWSMGTAVWDGHRRLMMRWNGTVDTPRGNPVSHGNATWFVVPDDPDLHAALLGLCQRHDAEAARQWLDGGPGEASLPDGGLKP